MNAQDRQEEKLIQQSGGIVMTSRANTTPNQIRDLAENLSLSIDDREHIAEFIKDIIDTKKEAFRVRMSNLKSVKS